MKNKLIPWKKREVNHEQYQKNALGMLHHEINDLFDQIYDGSIWKDHPFGETSGFELSETEDEVRVKAELPGMDESDILIHIQENTLTIRGEHRESNIEKKRKYHVSQMSFGSFNRSIALPAEVDAAHAKARFKRGVLTLNLPKTEQAKAERKRIPVRGY